ncbi:putative mitogen-activated protein kinase kinase kinase 7-like isoform X2 [Drosophila innubila]|uniref:putative mitogen-activated protein kinase kinase kinase 7-like isoform X2 n=1 Tax=Drosophila innubila TaxID=198719 RepID=UPI00148D60EF|nr:putative mitogen-activated protein kinase kinase kinase 7-like isoform X2 [Drosophila innubila]
MAQSVNFCDIELEEELGKDNYSIVNKAEWEYRTIAVKQYCKIGIVSKENLKEAYSKLLCVNHENILKFYGTSVSLSNCPSLLMEYADCGSLHEQIYGTGIQKYTTNTALNWMYQCAQGLAFLHAIPIFHCNLKPTNLFLTNNLRQLKIGELAINPEGWEKRGSIAYMAPEGLHNLLHKEKYDVYSFGMVLWEVLTRRKLFYRYDFLLNFLPFRCMCIMSGYHPSLTHLPEDLPSGNIRSMIECYWDNDPQKRPNMETVAKEIENCISSITDSNFTFNIKDMLLCQIIGYGSFGTVYKAQKLGVTYAAKRFHEQNDYVKKSIENEVKYLSEANHRNIIKFFGTMVNNEFKTIIIMEFADCGTLYDYIHQEGEEKKEMKSYTMSAALDLMRQLALGIEYLHAMPKPIIHRDIKTKNLLLANNYRTLKIADFGTVREKATMMTQSVGTAEYMAPEVANGKNYTEMSDVYSFGIVLWEAMSQKKPFYHLGNHTSLAIINVVSQGQ